MTTETKPLGSDPRFTALRDELLELSDVVAAGQLGDLLIERASHLQATDVHLDPMPDGLRVRLRVDGDLHDIVTLSSDASAHVVSRIKVLAGLDITEKRKPQDGRLPAAKNSHDIRVASGPTVNGERVILRLTANDNQLESLENLGLNPKQLKSVRRTLGLPYGLMLVTGPVGSGKSTTVYSALHELNDPSRSVVTIEDPVERRINGISQIQTDPNIDFDFAEALRGVLRQDANIMMVGEIRDSETARIACRAALTGTLVLSTLHASDTAAAIEVLRALKVPPLVIADSLKCVVTQRLVRKTCTESRETYRPDPAGAAMLGINREDIATTLLTRGVPADCNFHTGYSGRTAVYEVMEITEDIRHAILNDEPAGKIREIAQGSGFETLSKSLRAKVLDGTTTVEEMMRFETA